VVKHLGLLFTGDVPSSLIVATLMMEAIRSSKTSILAIATRCNIPEDSFLPYLCQTVITLVKLALIRKYCKIYHYIKTLHESVYKRFMYFACRISGTCVCQNSGHQWMHLSRLVALMQSWTTLQQWR
jgi:hypothetical protein